MRWTTGAALLVTVAGCAGPTGPVVGDWRGYPPSIDIGYSHQTELILDGTPDATSGTYHLVTLLQDPNFGAHSGENQNLRWSDRWEKRMQRDAGGNSYVSIHLRHAPGAEPADYILTSRGLLVPLVQAAHPDLSPGALRYALAPLPRSSWGYGRP